MTIVAPPRTTSRSSVASSTAPMTCSGTIARSNVSSRIARRSAVRSGTLAHLPKPNRWSTGLASVSGPAAPATMTALRWVTRCLLNATTARRRRNDRRTGLFEHLARREQRVGREAEDVARRRTIGVDDRRRDDHEKLGLERLPPGAGEQRAEDRNIHQVRDTVLDPLPFLGHEPGDDQALAWPHVDRRLDAARAERRDAEARDDYGVGVIEAGHLRPHRQRDQAVVEDFRSEAQTNAELAIRNGDEGLSALARLGNGHGDLAAGEEIPFLAVRRHQVRPRQQSGIAATCLGLDQREKVVGAEVRQGREEIALGRDRDVAGLPVDRIVA